MQIKAVIFDLDGTITRPYFDFDNIREEMGLDRNSGPILETMRKMTPSELIEAEKILYYHELKAVQESELNDFARETLSQLQSEGIKVGILTRNTKKNAYAISQKHDLKFDAVVGREDGPVKPDSFGVIFLCNHFGIKPSEALMVGDYLFDLICAKSAGSKAILLKNNEKVNDFEHEADYCIERIDRIFDIIENENSFMDEGELK